MKQLSKNDWAHYAARQVVCNNKGGFMKRIVLVSVVVVMLSAGYGFAMMGGHGGGGGHHSSGFRDNGHGGHDHVDNETAADMHSDDRDHGETMRDHDTESNFSDDAGRRSRRDRSSVDSGAHTH